MACTHMLRRVSGFPVKASEGRFCGVIARHLYIYKHTPNAHWHKIIPFLGVQTKKAYPGFFFLDRLDNRQSSYLYFSNKGNSHFNIHLLVVS